MALQKSGKSEGVREVICEWRGEGRGNERAWHYRATH